MLTLTDIDASYGQIQALWNVSLEVRDHEVVTLIGANGAGKSTTLRTIAGLLAPQRGRLTFDGRDITGLEVYARVEHGITLVPEARQLWPGLCVEENLELGAYSKRARGRKNETLKKMYELFPRLGERRRQKAATLSGGEQQICAIGRGLMSLPRLLLLDEPSLGLAPLLVKEVFEIIGSVRDSGVTVLLAEQNVSRALDVATRAYVLESGRVTLSGAARDLAANRSVREKFLGI